MRNIPLTQGKHAIVDDSDFEHLNQWKWYFSKGYAVRKLPRSGGKQGKIHMHRVVNKTPSGLETDHINRDRLDNQKANLRDATRTENSINQSKLGGCSSRYKGVYWNKRDSKWIAQIKRDGKKTHLGYFICEIVAAAKYDEEAEKHFGDFAKLNFTGRAL